MKHETLVSGFGSDVGQTNFEELGHLGDGEEVCVAAEPEFSSYGLG
jgi:hypothetical protein